MGWISLVIALLPLLEELLKLLGTIASVDDLGPTKRGMVMRAMNRISRIHTRATSLGVKFDGNEVLHADDAD